MALGVTVTGKMERYSNMRANPAKSIGFSSAEAEAQKADRRSRCAVENHVVKGITHYGIYREGFEEAMRVETAWFEKHLRGATLR